MGAGARPRTCGAAVLTNGVIAVLAFIVVLGVLIFVHELGHFLAAKWAGIWVHRFSVGMGNPIKALTFQRGETEYAISWLPLGGYVKMASREEEATSSALEGETPVEEVPPDRMFEAKPVWKRMIVILAGVFMNTLLAWAIYSGLALARGRAVNPETRVGAVDTTLLPAGARTLSELRPGDRVVEVNGQAVDSWPALVTALQNTPSPQITLKLADGRTLTAEVHPDALAERLEMAASLTPFLTPVAGQVIAGKPAEKAGILQGDTIVALNGEPMAQWTDVVRVIERSAGRPLAIDARRGSRAVAFTVVPDSEEVKDTAGERHWVGKIGVQVTYGTRYEKYPGVGAALVAGWDQTVVAGTTVWRALKGLVSGRVSSRNLGGPIAIGQMAGQAVRLGIDEFLAFMAFISINLAVLNLLPIPVLDGGQFLYLVAEAVARRPLPQKVRERLNFVGLALILALMVLAFSNDFRRIWESWTR